MNETASERAAMWDARYAPEPYAYGEAANAFLVAQAHRLKPGMRALVPGDGEGRNGVWLAEQGLACRYARPVRPRRRQGAPARGGARGRPQRHAGRRARLGLAARGLRRRRADLPPPCRRRTAPPSREGVGGAEAWRVADPRSVPARSSSSRRRRARAAAHARRDCSTRAPTSPPTSPGKTSWNSLKSAPSSRRAPCTSARARSFARSSEGSRRRAARRARERGRRPFRGRACPCRRRRSRACRPPAATAGRGRCGCRCSAARRRPDSPRTCRGPASSPTARSASVKPSASSSRNLARVSGRNSASLVHASGWAASCGSGMTLKSPASARGSS